MRVVPSLAYAATLEARQHSLLPAWQWPWWLMLATWLLAHTFCLLRFCYFGKMPWQHVTLWVRQVCRAKQLEHRCCHASACNTCHASDTTSATLMTTL
jgi:hypothetical protein